MWDWISNRWGKIAIAVAAAWLIGYELIWQWGVCHVYVDEGESLILRYKGPVLPFFGTVPEAQSGSLAKTDDKGNPLEMGILEKMLGPGRHFISPFHYEKIPVKDVVIPENKVGVVLSRYGEGSNGSDFLVDDELGKPLHKGILRQVLTPGRYRINDIAYKVDLTDAVIIPPGFVGVVTNKVAVAATGQSQGMQQKVLPSGRYHINPYEKRVDVVPVGLWADDISVTEKRPPAPRGRPAPTHDDEIEPVYEGGISFPSAGFTVWLDATAIWGIHPKDAMEVVRQFRDQGAAASNLATSRVWDAGQVRRNFILPRIDSICRTQGSSRSPEHLVQGDAREAFQKEFLEEFARVCRERNIEVKEALIRHIYVPLRFRKPVQSAKIAEEITKTRDVEVKTARKEAELEEARQRVIFEERRVDAETERSYQNKLAEGRKVVEETKADQGRDVAKIDAETAVVKAQTEKILGEARATAEKLFREAEADRFTQVVGAFRSPEAYSRWVFATGLPDNLEVRLFFAGPGTFWTDLQGMEQKLLGKGMADQPLPRPAPRPPAR